MRIRRHGNVSRNLSVLWSAAGIFLLSLFYLLVTIEAKGLEPHGSAGVKFTDVEGLKEVEMTETAKLTEKEGLYLLDVARKTIEKRLFDRAEQNLEDSALSPKYLEKRGTFVTLNKDGNLRGCIGHILPQEALIDGIRENAINAAFRDPRFNPLSKEEWDRIQIEISILTEPRPLEYSDVDDLLKKLRPGVDGVILKKGYLQATFLPQVWDQLPDKEEFLTHLCVKAGLDAYAWKKEKLEIMTYQVQAFEEH
jgi:AmmeMemoRadiSam system protein A